MKILTAIAFVFALAFAGPPSARADVSFQIGTDDFFLSVGDYDYLPYAYREDPGYAPPILNFRDMMSQYGRWVRVRHFGAVWQPYAFAGWRPYVYGHWIYTEYGPYWEGYEPWAWAGYHYGYWIFDPRYGWVWIPGYDWHSGRVVWAQGYGTIGWMPMPPDGYDYRRGRLSSAGGYTQFTYSDGDFGEDYGPDAYRYGGPYYDPRARDLYYNPSYVSVNVNLWVFIDASHFTQDNYADYDLGPDYTRYAFDQRTVRISNRPMEQAVLERITRRPIQRVQVEAMEFRTDSRPIKVVVPSGDAPVERMRQQSPRVIREIIAPAFAEQKKQFKGNVSKVQKPVSRIFRQESVRPRVESPTREQVVNTGREAQKTRELKQNQSMETVKQRQEQLKKEGKLKEPGNDKEKSRPQLKPDEKGPDTGGEPPKKKKKGPEKSEISDLALPAPSMILAALAVPPPLSRPAAPAPALDTQQPFVPTRAVTPALGVASLTAPASQPASPLFAPASQQAFPVVPAIVPSLDVVSLAAPSAQPAPPPGVIPSQRPHPVEQGTAPTP